MATNNEMKRQTISEMGTSLSILKQKLDILIALDDDRSASGSGDLRDQLMTLEHGIGNIESCLVRSMHIVPSE